MITLKQKDILLKALETYGEEAQIDMCIEELAELQVALCHYKRGRDHNIQEELADVRIMLFQMEVLFGYPRVELEMSMKINRLAERLKSKEGEVEC